MIKRVENSGIYESDQSKRAFLKSLPAALFAASSFLNAKNKEPFPLDMAKVFFSSSGYKKRLNDLLTNVEFRKKQFIIFKHSLLKDYGHIGEKEQKQIINACQDILKTLGQDISATTIVPVAGKRFVANGQSESIYFSLWNMEGTIFVNEDWFRKAGDQKRLAAFAHEVSHGVEDFYKNIVISEQVKDQSSQANLRVLIEAETDKKAIKLMESKGFNGNRLMSEFLKSERIGSPEPQQLTTRLKFLEEGDFLLASK